MERKRRSKDHLSWLLFTIQALPAILALSIHYLPSTSGTSAESSTSDAIISGPSDPADKSDEDQHTSGARPSPHINLTSPHIQGEPATCPVLSLHLFHFPPKSSSADRSILFEPIAAISLRMTFLSLSNETEVHLNNLVSISPTWMNFFVSIHFLPQCDACCGSRYINLINKDNIALVKCNNSPSNEIQFLIMPGLKSS